MGKLSKFLNAQSKLNSMYVKLDEQCGFKEPTQKELKKEKEKKQGKEHPEICDTCSYRSSKCWVGYTRNGACKNNHCRVYKEDAVEVKRLADLMKDLETYL